MDPASASRCHSLGLDDGIQSLIPGAQIVGAIKGSPVYEFLGQTLCVWQTPAAANDAGHLAVATSLGKANLQDLSKPRARARESGDSVKSTELGDDAFVSFSGSTATVAVLVRRPGGPSDVYQVTLTNYSGPSVVDATVELAQHLSFPTL